MEPSPVSQVYSRLDPPLWLLTAADGERRGGLIATTVAQASIVDSLPRQLVTIGTRHYTHALIEASGAFAMHLLDERQLDLAWRFGLQTGRDVDKFADLPFQTGATGSPLLTQAVAWLDCRVESQMDIGDRAVYLAAVVDGRMQRNASPLTTRRFFELAPPDKRRVMAEQYAHDANLDAESIRRWRAGN